MGITGLLPIVKKTLEKKHISEFKNRRIGIDGFPWLYQILNTVAEELFYNIATTKYVIMFEKRIKSLLSHSVVPVVVFDGDYLIAKEKTNLERTQRKEKYRKEVESYIARKNHAKARELMKRCIGVSKEIVYEITKVLVKHNVEYIIAPYEADAQLFYLEKRGYIDCIMTEDSDLIPYGCSNILFKFDGSYVDYYKVECLEKSKDKVFKEYIQDICILSGCDYVDSIPGIGIQTAHKLISKTQNLNEIIKQISLKKRIPENYLEEYRKAKLTFRCQIVFDPVDKIRRHLNPPEEIVDFLGTLEDVEYIVEIALKNSVLGEDKKVIKVQRHFQPSEIKMKEVKITDKKVFLEIDKNKTSPYFK
ncbi:Exonuclease 1 [Nosema granulosis]|uniref:Exonuclease 1 n=1 Tax=Nosema granulosis TaxID=83296 RepID=A0A9P6KZZ5_9MICR|nr:Exonuclease 1 [Nosema granulosis]